MQAAEPGKNGCGTCVVDLNESAHQSVATKTSEKKRSYPPEGRQSQWRPAQWGRGHAHHPGVIHLEMRGRPLG